MKTKRETTFERDCRAVAQQTGVDVDFCADERGSDVFEDDGTLHVVKRGVRAMFDVADGQSLSGVEQNARTRAVMEGLGMSSKITDRLFVEEDVDDDEDCCESCGRPW